MGLLMGILGVWIMKHFMDFFRGRGFLVIAEDSQLHEREM